MNWGDLLNIIIGVVIGSAFTYFITKNSIKENKDFEVSKMKIGYCDALSSLLGQYYSSVDKCKSLFIRHKESCYIARTTQNPNQLKECELLTSKYESSRDQVTEVSNSIKAKILTIYDTPEVKEVLDIIGNCLDDINKYFNPSSKNLEGLDEKIQHLKQTEYEFIKNYK